jgi:hypothetical protein
VIKRYAVDRSTLVESADGAVVMVADLPVEALEAAIRSMEDVECIEQDEATHDRFIKQLRDLLLAIRGEKS